MNSENTGTCRMIIAALSGEASKPASSQILHCLLYIYIKEVRTIFGGTASDKTAVARVGGC
jgi:hypothetical protein